MSERPPHVKRGSDRAEVFRQKAEQFLREHHTISSCATAVIDQNAGLRTRIFGLIGAGIRAFGAGDYVRKKLERQYDFSSIPINPEKYHFVEQHFASGYWSEVYMLQPKQEGAPTLVLKIEFPSKRAETAKLLETIKYYQADYLSLRDAYGGIDGAIPESSYFITKSPRTGQPAIAILQAYAGHDAFDALDPKNYDRVREIIANEPAFADEFSRFRAVSLDLDATHEAPDLAGLNNVLIVESHGKHSIKIVDHHRFDRNNGPAMAAQKRVITFLKESF